MRAESSVPPDQRYLMMKGRLGKLLIQELDEKFIPEFIQRQQKRGIPIRDKAIVNRYFNRDRAQDNAYFSLYAYADINMHRRYLRLSPRDSTLGTQQVDCTIDHIVYEGLLPISSIEHGHKHILFLRFAGGSPSCIPIYDTWKELARGDWDFGLS